MGKLSDVIETDRGYGFVAVRFGRKDGLRLELQVSWDRTIFGVGLSIWPVFSRVSLGLGFLTLFVMLCRPYHPAAAIVSGTPETEEEEARREEEERCCLLMEEIEYALSDMSPAELERVAAIIAAERGETP